MIYRHCALLFFCCLFTRSLAFSSDPPCTMKIGGVFPLTGPAAIIGERAQQAAVLSVESLKPELRSRISLQFEDSEMKAASGFRAVQKLAADASVLGLTGFGSETVSASAEFLEKNKVPTIFATPDRSPLIGKQFVFRHWVDAIDMFPVLAPEMTLRGIKKIAVVYSEIPAMIGFGTHFISHAPSAGLTVTDTYNVLPNDTDFRSVATFALKGRPDAVIFFLLPPQVSLFMKQLRTVSPHIPVFSYLNTENSHEVKVANGAMEGIVYTGTAFSTGFTEAFKTRFGEFPEFAAGNLYDIVRMYANALEAGACSREQVQEYIKKISNFSGVLGTYGIRDGNDFRLPVRLKIIQDGKFSLLKPRMMEGESPSS